MNVAIIGGTGYVGLVTGVGLAAHNHQVICADINETKINGLNNGILPIYEEGLSDLLSEVKARKKIHFTSNISAAVEASDIIFVSVGTPEGKNGETDISQLVRALKSIANNMNTYKLIAIKSTVPVGTNEMARKFLQSNLKNHSCSFDVVSNPEFLRVGSAVQDFLSPERIIVGADSKKAADMMKKLYSSFDTPIIVTDTKSAEMIKYACNSYLATRISFINEIAEICEKVNADIHAVLDGMKLDKRIGGLYLSPGPGFGGPCLSKDIKSLINTGVKANANVNLLKSVMGRNDVQIMNIMHTVEHELAEMDAKKVSVLGLSFKAGTNDTRNSPAIRLIEKLIEKNYEIVVYDPVVKQLEDVLNPQVTFSKSADEAAKGSDCLIIMTEWDEFKKMDLKSVYYRMRTPVIIDTRNILSVEEAFKAGIRYSGIGTRKLQNKETMKVYRNIV
ncbi:MAG: UDP-glucose/GDP-mannose dehydrogenase family protein [Clostridia bacterium]|nr:UDP-glucose/GDP-mannose dehydrogenase family protein [Clostridia bacterium]